MGRPRQYATPAARQAACRRRQRETQVLTDRHWLGPSRGECRGRLQAVVAPLARQGDPLACQLYRANLVTALESLTTWFQTRYAEHETGLGERAGPAPARYALGLSRSPGKHPPGR